MSYDDANAARREEMRIWTIAGNAGVTGKFLVFQKQRIIAAHARVDVAGTSAGHTVTVLQNGTTTLAQFVLSTQTSGVLVDVTGIAGTLNPGDYLSVVNGTDATGRAMLSIEMQQTPDAVRSAY